MDPFDVDEAEGLLVADFNLLTGWVVQVELVEVLQMVMPVRRGPNEQIRTGRGRADYQIGITGIVGEKVEAHDPMRPGSDAAVLHVVIVRAECFVANVKIPDYRYQVDAHWVPP
jgi:hypothetical protein